MNHWSYTLAGTEFDAEIVHHVRHIQSGCKLAIVGSTQLTGEAAREVVARIIDAVEPSVVISGGAIGIDTLAQQEAAKRGIPTDIELPKVPSWRDGFMPRNRRIAAKCDALVRVASKRSRTYGSGWTRDRAKEMGKPTVEFVLA